MNKEDKELLMTLIEYILLTKSNESSGCFMVQEQARQGELYELLKIKLQEYKDPSFITFTSKSFFSYGEDEDV